MNGEPVTLKDVAQRAGVSTSTASRITRGDRSRPVEAATEARIWEAARALGYRPNLLARSLVKGQNTLIDPLREIGIVLGTRGYKFSGLFFMGVLESIHAEILANRYHLRFIYSMSDLEDEWLRGEMVRPDIIGGLIGITLHDDALRCLAATGVAPIVVIEGPASATNVDFVSCDKESGIVQMMDHLWALGHRSYVFLGPPEEERARRFTAWLTLSGQPAAPIVDTHEAWDMETGYAAMRAFLSSNRDRPSVVVAACDTLAVGALRAAREMEMRVPDDMAIVGFDDTMGAFTNPALTSVVVQRERLGHIAVQRLIDRQRHPTEPSLRIVETTTLVVRESCGVRRHTTRDISPDAPSTTAERRDAPSGERIG